MSKKIENNDDYMKALLRFEEIKYAKKGTCEDKELKELAGNISAYENDLYPIERLSIIEMKQILIEDFGHTEESAKKVLSRLDRKEAPLTH